MHVTLKCLPNCPKFSLKYFSLPPFLRIYLKQCDFINSKQECIPVGCVPTAHWPYAGVCFRGGCLLRGVSAPGGSALGGWWGVCFWGVSALGCVCFWGVSASGEVSALGGCLLPGGVCFWGCLLGGVCSRGLSALGGVNSGGVCSGGCLLPGGLLLGGVCSRGCLLLGGLLRGGGIPACTEADTPPREQNDKQVQKYYLGHNFVAAGKKYEKTNIPTVVPHVCKHSNIRIYSFEVKLHKTAHYAE